jgi:hypothetical protein
MSENLDLVRSIYVDWEQGDFRRTDWADPEIEMTRPDVLEGGAFKGLASIAEGWFAWLSAWEDYRAEASEYRVIDDERVLVLARMRARGKLSGASVEMETANVFHLRNAKVTKLLIYEGHGRALADLGLEG